MFDADLYWNCLKRNAEWRILKLISYRQVHYHEHKRTRVCFSMHGNWHFPLVRFNNACQLKVNNLEWLEFYPFTGFFNYFHRFCCEWIDATPEGKRIFNWSCIQGFPWLVSELETTFSELPCKDNASPATAVRHGGHNRAVPPLHHSSQATSWMSMDETPMHFELPSMRSLEFTGSRTVPVKSCGAEKRRFSHACRRCGWIKTSTQGHLERRLASKRSRRSGVSPCFFPQERVDGWGRCEGMDSPVFAADPL